MEQATSLLPSEYAGEVEAGSNHLVNWHVLRSNQLRDMNRDNTLWEDGDLTMAGYEDAKCGQEVLVRRGGFTWRAYVTGVSHTIRALADWTTTLTLVRGTAFIERVRRKEGAMLQEVGRGPYSRTGRSQ